MCECKEEKLAIQSSILIKKLGEKNFVDLALKDSFDIIITDSTLVIKNLTDTVAVKEDDLPEEEEH